MELPARGSPPRPTTRSVATGSGSTPTTATWTEVAVPGHWQNTAKFATSNGPLMYRTRFTRADPGRRPAAMGDPRRDLLPGRRLARRRLPRRPRGLLLPPLVRHHRPQPVRRRARPRRRGHLRAADDPDRPAQHHRRAATVGVVRPAYNPGGLWRPVRLYDTGPVRVDRLRVLCRDADARRAHLRLDGAARQRRPAAGDRSAR